MPYIIRQSQTSRTVLARLVLVASYAMMAGFLVHTGYNSPLIKKQRGYVSRYAEPSPPAASQPAPVVTVGDHHP